MQPLKLNAPLVDYLWGGTRLKTEFGKQTNLDKVAESWELSCHKDGPSVISGGEFDGLTLPEYLDREGKGVLGTHCEPFAFFPMLIKLIDAAQDLSVQVHPSNEYALRVEGEYGKTEMWYVIDAKEGASLIYGLNREISKEEFASRIEKHTLLEVCNVVPVKKGDVFFIEAGTLHAIGAGILVAEVQQNSNTTYRVDDFGRLGPDGKPRELHVEKALDVTRLAPPVRAPGPLAGPQRKGDAVCTLLGACDYFTAALLEINGTADYSAGTDSFHSLLILDGSGELIWEDGQLSLHKGESWFLPAGFGNYRLKGTLEVVQSWV